jgi:hypothetical protein
VAAGFGQVGGQERGAPNPVEVVLRLAQVQSESIIEQSEAGQRLLQSVDRASGGLEVVVQVGGGGIVRGSLGQQPPLLAFPPSVQQVSTRHDELVAVVAPLTELTPMFPQFKARFRLLALICLRDRIG